MSKGVVMGVTWEAPGPGQWALDRSHLPPGATPMVQDIMRRANEAGMRRVFRELGSPVDTIDVGYVNGYTYIRVRPLVGGARPARRPPPLPLLRLAFRLHPELRRRAKRSEWVLANEPWMQVIHDWHHGTKAAVEAGNRALQDVDLAALDDGGLLAHVRACLDNCLRNWELHFWLHGYDLGPLGMYLRQCLEWGLPPDEALALLEGASPSTSGPTREAVAIRRQVEATGAQPSSLAELRALSPSIAAAVDRYLDHRGWVLFSRYDVDGVTLGERPDLVLATIMNAEESDRAGAVAARTAAVRDGVPAGERERFDDLLRQARDAMDLRDDNGPTTAEWPLGLLRRALLAVGDRMVERGLAPDRVLALELWPDDVAATSLDGLPDGAALRARAAQRAAQRSLDPPRVLGPDEPAPPLAALPAAMRQNAETVQVVIRFMGMDGSVAADGLSGSGIGARPCRGRACVAVSPEDALDRLQPGDVLVVAATTPAYNLVLSLAGGVVTAEGGPMSHAAVIARELGVPAVIGARAALTDIPDGALVEVDPVAGTVRVVG